jgi:polysaccharide pyruvyl transferase WcaK-like protein
LCVVTQVSVDDERSRRLASDLGAELVGRSHPNGHAAQERRLREVYRRTAVAASDRLHIIIAALTEGAAPVGLQLDDSDKISRHFSTIGIDDVALNTAPLTADAIATRVVQIARQREAQITALLNARSRLRVVKSQLHDVLGGVPARVGAGIA